MHFYHRQIDRQTDRRRRIRAHRATCTGGLNNQPIFYKLLCKVKKYVEYICSYGDKLFKWRDGKYIDLLSDAVNAGLPAKNYAGRSVACLDRHGSGKYGIVVATYSQGRLHVLRSAVGMIHDLRSDLWWTIPLRILLGQFWDTSWIPPDQVSPSQTHRCPGACGSRQKGHVVISCLRVYMGCALALVFQVRSLNVPCYMVHFQGSISGSP